MKPDVNIRTAHTRTSTVWLNSGQTFDGVAVSTTLVELEAYCAALRKAGAVDEEAITARPRDTLSARLTCEIPYREHPS